MENKVLGTVLNILEFVVAVKVRYLFNTFIFPCLA